MAPQEATIRSEEFYKSLARLEALAKGGQTGEPMNKSQICTGPNSERRDWPAGKVTDVPGNGPGADDIKPDGTDYNERGVRKSIRMKVKKGLPLSVDELALLKSDLDKAGPITGAGGMGVGGGMKPPAMKGMDADDDDDDKDDKKDGKKDKGKDDKGGFPFGKSMSEVLSSNDTVHKGIEVSEFLAEFAKSFGTGLAAVEQRQQAYSLDIGNQLFAALQQFASEQAEFNKSLAEAVANIGHGIAGSLQQVEQVAQLPVGAPKSQLRALPGGQQSTVLNKSFGGPAGGENLSKGQVIAVLQEMVEKSQINPLEVIKFDTTGEIRPDLLTQIQARIQGNGR